MHDLNRILDSLLIDRLCVDIVEVEDVKVFESLLIGSDQISILNLGVFDHGLRDLLPAFFIRSNFTRDDLLTGITECDYIE